LGGLVEGPDGNLYGTTAYGGTNGHGTIFRVTRSLQLTTLHSFTDFGQGEYPNAALLAAKDGFLYGLVPGEGTNSTGTIFRFSTNGQFSALFQMNNSNGNYVVHSASLAQGVNGLIYGVTPYGGGTDLNGTIFSLDVRGSPSSPPSIVSETFSKGIYTMTYNSTPGSTYQILYSADLLGTNWAAIGPPTVATNNSATASFAIPTNYSQGFYKFMIKP
jgi:uncharacterized repeat protein (TIGR03803 family)